MLRLAYRCSHYLISKLIHRKSKLSTEFQMCLCAQVCLGMGAGVATGVCVGTGVGAAIGVCALCLPM